MIKSVKLLKRSVIYKLIGIVKSKKFFSVNNMVNLRRFTSFIKFNIGRVIPKPRGILPPFFIFSTVYLYKIIDGSRDTCSPLSETKSLPAKLSWVRTSDLLRRFFLLITMPRFFFLHLNLNHKIPIVFYNLKNCNWQLIMPELGKSNFKIKIKSSELEKYIRFNINNKLIFHFLSSSLNSLIKNLGGDNFKYYSQEFDGKIWYLGKTKKLSWWVYG